IAETIAADLRNVALLRRMLRITAPAQDVDALLTELRDRVMEELDYRREAANQRLLAAYYDGHPTIHVPGIISELSTRRMVTSELSGGARFACVEHDPEAFRRSLENAGFLRPGAPLSTQAIVEHLAVFYDTIREPGPLTITSDYASAVVRRFFDVRSPVADYISVPRSYV